MAERIIKARQVISSADARDARHQGRQMGERVRVKTTQPAPDAQLFVRTITTSTRQTK